MAWFQAFGFLSTLFLSTSNTLLSAALAKKGMRFRGDPSTSILVIEVLRLTMALAWYVANRKKGSNPLSWTFLLRSLRYAVPAGLYLIMNTMIIMMVSEFGGLNTVLLLNLKIPATGLLAWLILGRRVTWTQVVALFFLCVGTTLSQLPEDVSSLGSGFQPAGLLYGLLYALMSGLSGVFTEKLLRGAPAESLALQQAQLYAWGTVANLGVVYSRGWQGPTHWDHPLVVVMIVSQVLSGLVTAWLLRTQGSYARVFLHSLVGVCVGVFGFVTWGDPIRATHVLALIVITVSIYCFHVFEAPKDQTKSPEFVK